jgi:hypothetical protein
MMVADVDCFAIRKSFFLLNERLAIQRRNESAFELLNTPTPLWDSRLLHNLHRDRIDEFVVKQKLLDMAMGFIDILFIYQTYHTAKLIHTYDKLNAKYAVSTSKNNIAIFGECTPQCITVFFFHHWL